MSIALLSRFHPWRKSTPLWHSRHNESTLKPHKGFVSFLGRLLTLLPVPASSLWRANNMTYFRTNLMTLACERQWQDLDRCCSQVWPLPARHPPAQRAVSAIKSHLSFPMKRFSPSCRDVGLHWWGAEMSVMQISHVSMINTDTILRSSTWRMSKWGLQVLCHGSQWGRVGAWPLRVGAETLPQVEEFRIGAASDFGLIINNVRCVFI